MVDTIDHIPLKAHGRFTATGKTLSNMVDTIDHIPLKAHGRFAATGLEWNWQESAKLSCYRHYAIN
jgi:hypothetical protein